MTHTDTGIDQKIRNSTISASWFTFILIFILLAALNFVRIFSASLNEHEAEHHAAPATTTQVENTAAHQHAVETTTTTENVKPKEEQH